jgi:hypothetical protein
MEMYHLLERCTSPAKDAASHAVNATSRAEDVGASPKFWICDTAVILLKIRK